MMVALLALTVLGALAPTAPALALTAKLAAPASCDGLGAACAQQATCRPDSAPAANHAQTPPLAGAVLAAHWHEPVLPLAEGAAAADVPLAQSGPPAYLRFHRFLL